MRKICCIAFFLIIFGCAVNPVYRGARIKPVTYSDLTDEEKQALFEMKLKEGNKQASQPPPNTAREDIDRMQNTQKQVLRSMGIPTPP